MKVQTSAVQRLSDPLVGGVSGCLHPRLVEIQQLYLQKKVALVANVGMLVKQTSRAQYLAQAVPVPQNLFSHSDQQDQWQTSFPNSFSPTGWAGRTADLLEPMNAPSLFPPVVSVVGSSLFCEGQSAVVAPAAGAGLASASKLGLGERR